MIGCNDFCLGGGDGDRIVAINDGGASNIDTIVIGADNHNFHMVYDTSSQFSNLLTGSGTSLGRLDSVRSWIPNLGGGRLYMAYNSTYQTRGDWETIRAFVVATPPSSSETIHLVWDTNEATELLADPADVLTESPTWCNSDLYYHWDGGSPGVLQIGIAGSLFTVATGITSQALLEAEFETYYFAGTYGWAYNTTTGVICIIWVEANGTPTFEFSVDLDEELNLGDEASAELVARYPVDRRKWVVK